MNYNNAQFEKAFAKFEQLEQSDLPEICFCDIPISMANKYFDGVIFDKEVNEPVDDDLKEVMFIIEYKRKRNEERQGPKVGEVTE